MLDQNCDTLCFRIVEWETLHHINYISNKYLQIMIMIRCYALHITSVNTTLLAPFTTSVGPLTYSTRMIRARSEGLLVFYCHLVVIVGHWRRPGPNVQHGKQQYIIYTHTQSILQVEAVTVNVFCFSVFRNFLSLQTLTYRILILEAHLLRTARSVFPFKCNLQPKIWISHQHFKLETITVKLICTN